MTVVPERGTFADVLRILDLEHRRAVQSHGFTEEHDDRHGDADWAWRLLRRVSELMTPPTVLVQSPEDRRRALIEVAHIAASAVAAHDRRSAVEDHATGQIADVVRNVATAADLGPGELVVATGGGFMFVARPDNPGRVERHALDCGRYRDTDPCTGCADAPKGDE